MKALSGLLLNFLLFVFSYLIPKDKNLILFGAGNGKAFKGNPKYLYLYAIKNKISIGNINLVWSTENRKIYQNLTDNNFPVIAKKSWKGFLKILRAKYVVVEQSAKDFSYTGFLIGRFNIIQTWHGTPLKYIGFDNKPRNSFFEKTFNYFLKREFRGYKLICSSSDEVSKILEETFFNKNSKITGYPRNDVFFNNELSYENVYNNLSLFNYSKVISYIPTFRDTETKIKPFTSEGLHALNKYLKDNNYIFILKKHPFDKNFPKLDEFSNIKDFSEEINDVQELLVHTDLLITDYSSVFFDFCLTDKPIIYYPYDYQEYIEKCRGMYFSYYDELPGPFAKNEQELLGLIKTENEWSNDSGHKVKYKEFKKRFNKYQDGNSCERLLKEFLVLK